MKKANHVRFNETNKYSLVKGVQVFYDVLAVRRHIHINRYLIEESRRELNRGRKDIPLAIVVESLCIPGKHLLGEGLAIQEIYIDQA